MHSVPNTERNAAASAANLPQSPCSALEDHGNLRVPINVLPNEILLDIFEHYLSGCLRYPSGWSPQFSWCTLAHVSARWREVLFASAQRLNLIFYCNIESHMPNAERIALVPPSVPLALRSGVGHRVLGLDGLLGCALQYWDRVGQIVMSGPRQVVQRTLAAMPDRLAPSLVDLDIHITDVNLDSESNDNNLNMTPPANFLRGLAPRLIHVTLSGISLSILPPMLSNPARLAPLRTLNLYDVDPGFTSLNALVDTLRAVPQLTKLILCSNHHLSGSRDAEERLSPATYEIIRLPSLNHLDCQGPSWWVEALAARLETPALSHVEALIVDEELSFLPNLSALVVSAKSLRFDRAIVEFDDEAGVEIRLSERDHENFFLEFSCTEFDDQTRSLSKFCEAIAEKLPTVRGMVLTSSHTQNLAPESRPWLNFLLPFSGICTLCAEPTMSLVLCHILRPSQTGGLPERLLPDLRRIVVFMEKIEGRTMMPNGPTGPEVFSQYRDDRKCTGQTVPTLWGISDPTGCNWGALISMLLG
ncbi:hypothetical protein BC834DRAFT_1034892 [Gloeopeniophorella convolvens]|nr:hypothetical protein BC834DRAFT_1034892 [Gloeopeniophorella convolvens]